MKSSNVKFIVSPWIERVREIEREREREID